MPPSHPKRLAIVIMTIALLLTACTAQPTPSRNQTGLADLDAVIATALEGNTATLRPLLKFTQTQCTFAEGLGGPPKCLPGEVEGSSVEVLPFLGPGEGSFLRKTDIANWSGIKVSRLFAVYQVSAAAYSDPDYPAGEYAVVLIGSSDAQTSIILQIRQGRIIRIDTGMGYPPAIRQSDIVRYLVPPVYK